MALKRVRFAVEEERCEHCSQTGHKRRQQQRRLDTALQLQRMAEPQRDQLQQQLLACRRDNIKLQCEVWELQRKLDSASHEVGNLEAQLQSARRAARELEGQLDSARHNKRQRDSTDAEASRAQVAEVWLELANCQAELQVCRAEAAKRQEADRRHSWGGSHPAENQQCQQQQVQAEGSPAGGPAEGGAAAAQEPAAAAAAEEPAAVGPASGGAAPAVAGASGASGAAPSSMLDTSAAAQVLEELHVGGPVAGQPAQQRRQASSDSPSGRTQPPQTSAG